MKKNFEIGKKYISNKDFAFIKAGDMFEVVDKLKMEPRIGGKINGKGRPTGYRDLHWIQSKTIKHFEEVKDED